jgi:hypothetical protein
MTWLGLRCVSSRHMAAYDCSEMLDEVAILYVERIHFSGLLLFSYYRLTTDAMAT